MLSTKNAKHMTLDIKDFCLNSKLKEYKCMFIDLNLILDGFIALCNLDKLMHDSKVLAKARSGTHRL